MAYIPSHQTLKDHPKLKRLARRLSVSEVATIGHLHLLWWWALDYAPNGSLFGRDVLDISIGAGWEGDENLFVSALIECGFIDDAGSGELEIHDWDEYGGQYQERREKDRERKRTARRIQRQQSDVPDVSNGRPQEIQRTATEGKERKEEERKREERIPPKSPKGDSPPDFKPWDLFAAMCEEAGHQPEEITGKARDRQLQAAKQLIQSGATPDDIVREMRWLSGQSWVTSGVDMALLYGQWAKWTLAGKPEFSQGNGRASPIGNGSLPPHLQPRLDRWIGEAAERGIDPYPLPEKLANDIENWKKSRLIGAVP